MSYFIIYSQKVLDGVIHPLHFSQVWIYDCNKTEPLWEITILLLKDKKLYLSSNVSTAFIVIYYKFYVHIVTISV